MKMGDCQGIPLNGSATGGWSIGISSAASEYTGRLARI